VHPGSGLTTRWFVTASPRRKRLAPHAYLMQWAHLGSQFGLVVAAPAGAQSAFTVEAQRRRTLATSDLSEFRRILFR
jgi:hypothetical protein